MRAAAEKSDISAAGGASPESTGAVATCWTALIVANAILLMVDPFVGSSKVLPPEANAIEADMSDASPPLLVRTVADRNSLLRGLSPSIVASERNATPMAENDIDIVLLLAIIMFCTVFCNSLPSIFVGSESSMFRVSRLPDVKAMGSLARAIV
jgi:hypothetical protein